MLTLLNRPLVLIALCALSYAAATLAMKSVSQTPGFVLVAAIAICLAVAVLAEVILMRNMTMGVTYVAILCVETLLVLVFACALGEVPSIKQIAGALMVLGGAALVSA
jgi:small multidrug resistance pump